jgi:hypothetical protein
MNNCEKWEWKLFKAKAVNQSGIQGKVSKIV